MRICSHCGKILKNRQSKYCSNKCQSDHAYTAYIASWKRGNKTGNRGVNTKNISGYLKRYLTEKFREKCALCAWSERHSLSGRVPLEIDHIDGDAENNKENNLRLICPNCHSLTTNYKNFNKGRGRKWRVLKYLKA